jgi:hypothetical protein
MQHRNNASSKNHFAKSAKCRIAREGERASSQARVAAAQVRCGSLPIQPMVSCCVGRRGWLRSALRERVQPPSSMIRAPVKAGPVTLGWDAAGQAASSDLSKP